MEVIKSAQQSVDTTRDNEQARWLRIVWSGRLLAPALAGVVYVALWVAAPDLGAAGRATAAIAVLMAVLWITEALPLAVTALIPIVLFPLTGVLPVSDAAAPFASEVIFLFLGGFIIALAIQRWGLHQRIAWWIIRLVGTRPARLTGGVMAATALLGMWISNTATTLMMLPIATSVVQLVTAQLTGRGPDEAKASTDDPSTAAAGAPRFATGLLLGIAYAASIASVTTLISTPPNLIMRAYLQETYDIVIDFGKWMLFGVPVAAVFLVIAWLLLTKILYRPEIDRIPGGRALVQEELRRMGPMSRGERIAATVFLVTAILWIFREPLQSWDWLVARVPTITHVTDAAIAITAALVLFAIPVDPRQGIQAMDWDTARGLPWEVLLLFGGGLSLAAGIQASGLDAWIGGQATGLGTLPPVVLVAIICLMTTSMSELMSNTALAATFLPIIGGVAPAIGVDPLLLVVPATLAGTFSFTLPVSTPPNAIVFSTGHVTMKQMVTTGIWLSLIGVVVTTLATFTLLAWVFGVDTGGPTPPP